MCRCLPISPSWLWPASTCRRRWSPASRTSPGYWDSAMALLNTIAHRETVKQHRPWPRALVTDDGWRQAIEHLAAGRCTLLGLWGDAGNVHMALVAENFGDIAVLSYACKDGTYPSVGARHPPAIRLERAIRDLHGLDAAGSPDTRPWLTHASKPYEFLPSEGEGLHQNAVGPVHAGII